MINQYLDARKAITDRSNDILEGITLEVQREFTHPFVGSSEVIISAYTDGARSIEFKIPHAIFEGDLDAAIEYAKGCHLSEEEEAALMLQERGYSVTKAK